MAAGLNNGSDPRVLVFVPAFNDRECLNEIVDEVTSLAPNYACLVVDDGSNPPIELDNKPRSLVCRLPANFGLGVATQIALDHAARHSYDFLVRIDGDGQHPTDRIPDLIERLQTKSCDIVAGTRRNRATDRTPKNVLRWLVRSYFRILAKALTKGQCPRDVNTGFIAMSRKAIHALRNEEFNRFPEPELFVLANRLNLEVGEVEIFQDERRFGISTLTIPAALRMASRFTLFALAELLRGRP